MGYKKVRKTLKTAKWKKFAERTKRKYSYLCQESLRFGERVEAEMIHHIFPVDNFPELEFVSWNVIPVTFKKHETFHDRTNDEITKIGKIWQRKRKKEFEEFYGHPPSV